MAHLQGERVGTILRLLTIEPDRDERRKLFLLRTDLKATILQRPDLGMPFSLSRTILNAVSPGNLKGDRPLDDAPVKRVRKAATTLTR